MIGILTGLEVTLAVVLALVVWGMVAAALAVTGAVRRWREPILLRPGDRVPLLWRWSPGPAAVLHRRLVTAVRWVRLARPPGWPPQPEPGRGPLHAWRARRRLRAAWDPSCWPAWVAPVVELEDLAAAIDRRLLQSRGQPRGLRLAILRDLAGEVATLEGLARRLVGTLRAWEMSVEQPGERVAPGDRPLEAPTTLGPARAAAWPQAPVSLSDPAPGRAGASITGELDALDAALEELRRRS